MSTPRIDPLVQVESTCRSLLDELQIIWDEVGETDADRDKMLLEIKRECLEAYRRKVDHANQSRAHIKQTIADSEAELASICSSMGERPVHIRQSEPNIGNLKEELGKILPRVEEMKKRKVERINHFMDVLDQINMIKDEINGSTESVSLETVVDEMDLSLSKLEELHTQLHELQKEKSNRLKQVQDHLIMLNSLCSVLGMDFKLTVSDIHPSLGDSEGLRSISNNTVDQLGTTINNLREVKIQRMERLQDLATTILELWNLMDTPIEEQQKFQNVTCNIAASEQEITEPNTLSEDFISNVEAEVSRLEELKSSKLKELVLKKRTELKEISKKTHLEPDNDLEDVIEAIDTGVVDAETILEQIELQISKVKEEAFSRKEILERVEKWLAACEEECWLEEYNKDENRYNLGKGTHLTLKRAEKARALVNKLPGMVEVLTSKVMAWQEEREAEFLYDGVLLLSMLEDYATLREEKEQERRRLRDQKKLHGHLIAEQEVLYGSKVSSPSKAQSVKKGSKQSTGVPSSKKVALGGAMLQNLRTDSFNSPRTPQTRSFKKTELMSQNDRLNHHQDDAIPASPAFKGGLDIADIPFRNHSLDAVIAKEAESPLKRTITPKTIPYIVDKENRKQKAMASTASIAMQTDMTPAPDEEINEEIEQSFEEGSLAFKHTDAKIPSMIQV